MEKVKVVESFSGEELAAIQRLARRQNDGSVSLELRASIDEKAAAMAAAFYDFQDPADLERFGRDRGDVEVGLRDGE